MLHIKNKTITPVKNQLKLIDATTDLVLSIREAKRFCKSYDVDMTHSQKLNHLAKLAGYANYHQAVAEEAKSSQLNEEIIEYLQENITLEEKNKLVPTNKKKDNSNLTVIGPAGSGKSVLLSELTLETLAKGADVISIDIGASSLGLTKTMGGEIVEIDEDPSIGYNFYLYPDERTRENTERVQGLFEVLSKKKYTEAESKFFHEALSNAYYKNGNVTQIKDIYRELEELSELTKYRVMQEPESMIRLLIEYGHVSGKYYNNFNSSKILTIEKRLTYFELPDTRDETLVTSTAAALIYLSEVHMRTAPPKQEGMLMMEELWYFVKSRYLLDFLYEYSALIGKYKGTLAISTQRIADFERDRSMMKILMESMAVIISADSYNIPREEEKIVAFCKGKVVDVKEGYSPGTKEYLMLYEGELLGKFEKNKSNTNVWLVTTNPGDLKKIRAVANKRGVSEPSARLILQKEERSKEG